MHTVHPIARIKRAALGGVLAAGLAVAVTTVAQAQQKVTYLLPAPAFLPAFGPWMLAKGKGYYAAEGLDVEFKTARGGADVAKQVGAGNAVIGGASATPHSSFAPTEFRSRRWPSSAAAR